jgi:ppGpp synthetase/RelA/SpoT-type nucleotidyltranferase
MSEIFDFEAHRNAAIRGYATVRPIYKRYCGVIDLILRMALRHVHVHQISTRTKSVESFADKASKPSTEDPTHPKYFDPLNQITDLAGARVIAFVLRDLPTIEDAILREFVKREKIDKGEELVAKNLVGYRSIHYIVELEQRRTDLGEYHEFQGLRAEIQIRTILQHAWAEMEHDVRFKSERTDAPLFQRFTALAGLIEIGDREFDQIFELDEQRKQRVRELAQISDDPTTQAETPTTPEKEVLGSNVPGTPHSPRELIGIRRYSDAIIAYNRLIAEQSGNFNHYLGRAKARFLNGDEVGAFSDIEIAERLKPGHPFINEVRRALSGSQSDLASREEQRLTIVRGHEALVAGEGTIALQLYQKAAELGLSPVLAALNLSMAQIVSGRPREALEAMTRVTPFPASFLEFVVVVIRGICQIMLKEQDVATIECAVNSKRREMLERGVEFSYWKSSLPRLEGGIERSRSISDGQKTAILSLLAKLHDGDRELRSA